MAHAITYYAGGRKLRLPVQSLYEAPQVRLARMERVTAFRVAPQRMGAAIATSLDATDALVGLFEEPEPEAALITPTDPGRTAVIPTASVVLEQGTKQAVKILKSHGLTHVR